MKVVAYIRVSTDKEEQEASIDNQIKLFHQWVKANNHTIIESVGIHHSKESIAITKGMYIDEGFSAYKDTRRKAFDKMMQDAKKGLFDVIWTKSVSRFSRNNRVFINTADELIKLNIDATFYDDNKTLKNDIDLSLPIMSLLSAIESKNKSAAIKSAIKIRQKEGIITTTLAYGYARGKEKGEVLIIPEQAEIVKEIYKLYLQGWGGNKIARYLNNKGIPTQKGSVWNERNILNVLGNQIYIGWYVSYKVIKNRKREEIQRGAVPHLRILDDEIFYKVQDEMKHRSKQREQGIKTSSQYLLSNLLWCDNCGNTIRRKIQKGVNKNRIYWLCSQNIRNGKAKCAYINAIHEKDLEEAVKQEIIKTKQLNYSNLQYIFDGYKEARYNIKEVKERIPELEEKTAEAKNSMMYFLKNAAKQNLPEDIYNETLKELTNDYNQFNNEYNRCLHIEDELKEKEKQYKKFIETVKAVDVDNLTNEVLKKLFYKIYIGTDELVAEFGKEVAGDVEKKYIRFEWNILDEKIDMVQLRQDINQVRRAKGKRIEKT